MENKNVDNFNIDMPDEDVVFESETDETSAQDTIKHGKSKYLATTGQKLEKKSLRKLKKEHRIALKEEKKDQKKQSKKQKKVDKKLTKHAGKSDKEEQSSQIDSGVQKSVQNKILIVRKTEKGRPVTKKKKILNLLSYALVGFVAIVFGYFGGNFYYANFMNKVDYSKFDVTSLRDDEEAVYNGVVARITPDRSTAIQLFVAAEYKLKNTENYNAAVSGEVQPSIGSKQLVNGVKGRNGDEVYLENISKGMMSVAEKYSYSLSEKQASIFHAEGGAIVDMSTVNYSADPTWILSEEQFLTEYGTAPDNPCIPYIVSSKTYIPGSDSVRSVGDGTFEIKFNLAKDSSVVNYVKQIKHMSGLSSYPTFKTISVIAVIDSQFRFVSLYYEENYTVTYFGIPANCDGWIKLDITY
ncbi:MAG: hypothetical protein IJS74_02585 [Clostridia bacterium]|nr:hypothetical protein [Clostridia bacterium]